MARQGQAVEYLLRSLIVGSDFENHAYIAGGYVRDEVMGRDAKDIDVVVTDLSQGGIALAKYIAEALKLRPPVVYQNYGTAQLTLADSPPLRAIVDQHKEFRGVSLSAIELEFVMARKESYQRDSRKPAVEAGTLQDDVERRDFYINTLLKDLSSGELIDPLGQGFHDIEHKLIRTPLEPVQTFQDDPLRMLRAIRFAVQLDFTIPDYMLSAIRECASELDKISAERIRDELQKILLSAAPARGLQWLRETQLAHFIFPEVEAIYDYDQMNPHHHLDLWNHTLAVVEATPVRLAPRLAALLHDLGKPEKAELRAGVKHFRDHESCSVDITARVLKRLAWSNELQNVVVRLVSAHGRRPSPDWSAKAYRKLLREHGDIMDDLIDLMHADQMAHAPEFRNPEYGAWLRGQLARLLAEDGVKRYESPLRGDEIMSALSLAPGPKVGEVSRFLVDAVLSNPALSKAEAIALIQKEFADKPATKQ